MKGLFTLRQLPNLDPGKEKPTRGTKKMTTTKAAAGRSKRDRRKDGEDRNGGDALQVTTASLSSSSMVALGGGEMTTSQIKGRVGPGGISTVQTLEGMTRCHFPSGRVNSTGSNRSNDSRCSSRSNSTSNYSSRNRNPTRFSTTSLLTGQTKASGKTDAAAVDKENSVHVHPSVSGISRIHDDRAQRQLSASLSSSTGQHQDRCPRKSTKKSVIGRPTGTSNQCSMGEKRRADVNNDGGNMNDTSFVRTPDSKIKATMGSTEKEEQMEGWRAQEEFLGPKASDDDEEEARRRFSGNSSIDDQRPENGVDSLPTSPWSVSDVTDDENKAGRGRREEIFATPSSRSSVTSFRMSGAESGEFFDKETKEDDEEMVVSPAKLCVALQKALLENRTTQKSLETVQRQRTKAVANLKRYKRQAVEAEKKVNDLESQLEQTQANLMAENASIRSGLQKVVAVRDDLKNKLRVKNEVLKESRVEHDALRRRLNKCEKEREMERELLNHYRKLAQHTGYFKWGKQIRALESNLSASLMISNNDGGDNTNGSNGGGGINNNNYGSNGGGGTSSNANGGNN